MQKLLIIWPFSFLLFFSCTNSPDADSFSEITIDETQLILSAETDADIARPSTIRATDSGFYLYDFGLQKILKFDKNGNQQLMFGEEGQGPGEFQGLGGFWEFGEDIILFDQRGAKFLYYSKDGSFLKENAIKQEDFAPGLTMAGLGQLYLPLHGRDGKLAKFIDKTSGERFSFGDTEVEAPDFDPSVISQSIERGNLPDYMLGRVSIAADHNRVYLFHMATGKLQAFDNGGNLLAEVLLDLQVMEKIKAEFFEHSHNALEQGFFILFSYIHSMIATENGVALLLNSPAGHPVTILFLDHNLENLTALYYDSESLGRVQMFDIDEVNHSVYFVNAGTSEIFMASWNTEE